MNRIKRKFQSNSQTTIIIRKKVKRDRTNDENYLTTLNAICKDLCTPITDSSAPAFVRSMSKLVMFACSTGDQKFNSFLFDMSSIVVGFLAGECFMLYYLETRQFRNTDAVESYFNYLEHKSYEAEDIEKELDTVQDFVIQYRTIGDGYKILNAAHKLAGESVGVDLTFHALLREEELGLLYRSWFVANNHQPFTSLKVADITTTEMFALGDILADESLDDSTTILARIAMLDVWKRKVDVDVEITGMMDEQMNSIRRHVHALWTTSMHQVDAFCLSVVHDWCIGKPGEDYVNTRSILESLFRNTPITIESYRFWSILATFLHGGPMYNLVNARCKDFNISEVSPSAPA